MGAVVGILTDRFIEKITINLSCHIFFYSFFGHRVGNTRIRYHYI